MQDDSEQHEDMRGLSREIDLTGDISAGTCSGRRRDERLPRETSAPVLTSTVIVDRCALFREGLKQAIGQTSFTVVASEADLNDVRFSPERSTAPLLILLVSSSDFSGDLAAVKSARARFPKSAIVALFRVRPPHPASLLKVGANAILPVPNSPEELVGVLELVMLGQHVVPLDLISRCIHLDEPDADGADLCLTDAARSGTKLSRLSTREAEIVRCLLAGEPNRSIAQRLMIAEATVKVHVKAILRKIKVKNRTQAAIWALNNTEAAKTMVGLPSAVPAPGQLSEWQPRHTGRVV